MSSHISKEIPWNLRGEAASNANRSSASHANAPWNHDDLAGGFRMFKTFLRGWLTFFMGAESTNQLSLWEAPAFLENVFQGSSVILLTIEVPNLTAEMVSRLVPPVGSNRSSQAPNGWKYGHVPCKAPESPKTCHVESEEQRFLKGVPPNNYPCMKPLSTILKRYILLLTIRYELSHGWPQDTVLVDVHAELYRAGTNSTSPWAPFRMSFLVPWWLHVARCSGIASRSRIEAQHGIGKLWGVYAVG